MSTRSLAVLRSWAWQHFLSQACRRLVLPHRNAPCSALRVDFFFGRFLESQLHQISATLPARFVSLLQADRIAHALPLSRHVELQMTPLQPIHPAQATFVQPGIGVDAITAAQGRVGGGAEL